MFCNKVKEFLSEHGIAFDERDVVADQQALADLEKLGILTTPVTLIGDEQIIGFDRARLEHLLAL